MKNIQLALFLFRGIAQDAGLRSAYLTTTLRPSMT